VQHRRGRCRRRPRQQGYGGGDEPETESPAVAGLSGD